MTTDEALWAVAAELTRARERYPAFHSGHEGIAVIWEEVDELWDEVKRSVGGVNLSANARNECVQIAAMALRFLLDVCDEEVRHDRASL